jgi:hypothetical protein
VAAILTHLHALTQAQSCPQCDTAIAPVITDVARLLATSAYLYDELANARLDGANLRAAIQAALCAAADGESDPLAYLRWELPEHGAQSPAGPAGGRV